MGGDGSTCDSLGAALGRGGVVSSMMTIKGELTCKCHVKELKPVFFKRLMEKIENSNLILFFFFMNGAFSLCSSV